MIGLAFLKAAVSFIAKNWRWLLPLLAVLLLCWYIAHLQDQRAAAIKSLADYQHQIAEADQARKIENARKESQAIVEKNAIQSHHQSEIETLRRRYETRNTADKAAADYTLDLWRERVRLEVERQSTAGLSSNPGPAGQPAESGGNCDTAAAGQDAEGYIETLEIACAVTTSDYNALRKWSDSVCDIFGCQ